MLLQSGQDVSGGAINAQGVGPTTIVGTKFWDNSASNGGGVGIQSHDLTIVNSSFDHNAATGTDGNPGNGGDGGAVSFDGAMTSFVICGTTFTNNTSGAQGGALFRVAYTDEPTTIDQCTFDSNESDTSVGLAGAIYLEYTAITMTATTISNNAAHYGGGFWIGHHAIADITNVTIANNTADQGGGVWVSDEVTGLLLNVTLANNVDTPGGYAPGWFGGDANLAFQNCIVSGVRLRGRPARLGRRQHPPPTRASCASRPRPPPIRKLGALHGQRWTDRDHDARLGQRGARQGHGLPVDRSTRQPAIEQQLHARRRRGGLTERSDVGVWGRCGPIVNQPTSANTCRGTARASNR